MADVVNTPDIAQQFLGNDGKPLASGYLKFFRNGTDIPAPVYTSDGETALGNTIELDASGFPVVQFSLKTGQLYTVKAFDSDDVLIWTRNDISGSSEGGAGNWVPMEGTSLADPMTGSLVWKDGQYIGTANQHGMVLTDSREGASILSREGLDTVVGDLEGDYRNYQAKLTNAQNGFSGYPDFAELTTRALTLNRETSNNGTRVEKQIDIRPASTANGENTITTKGTLTINNLPGDSIFILASNNLQLQGQSVAINPTSSGNVLIGPNAKLITKNLAIGTNLNNKEINDIWTSSSTGAPSDSQLITAKAALEACSNEFWSIEGWSAGQANSVTFEAGYFYYSEIFPRVGSKFKRFVYLSGGNVTANGLTFAIYNQSRQLVTKSSTITVHSGNTSPSLIVELEDEVSTSDYAFGDTGLAHFYVGMLNDSDTGTNFVGQAIVPPASSYRSGRFAATELPTTFTLGGNTYFRFPRLVLNLY